MAGINGLARIAGRVITDARLLTPKGLGRRLSEQKVLMMSHRLHMRSDPKKAMAIAKEGEKLGLTAIGRGKNRRLVRSEEERQLMREARVMTQRLAKGEHPEKLGINSDYLREATGRFKPENEAELELARRLIRAGAPRQASASAPLLALKQGERAGRLKGLRVGAAVGGTVGFVAGAAALSRVDRLNDLAAQRRARGGDDADLDGLVRDLRKRRADYVR